MASRDVVIFAVLISILVFYEMPVRKAARTSEKPFSSTALNPLLLHGHPFEAFPSPSDGSFCFFGSWRHLTSMVKNLLDVLNSLLQKSCKSLISQRRLENSDA